MIPSQRDIKFRVWEPQDGNMFSPSWPVFGHLMDQKDKEGIIVMQYTGLKDKNNKEIYEGDILLHASNYEPYKCVIEWKDDLGSCGCCFYANESVGFVGVIKAETEYSYSILASEYKEMEIIGNIHENPTLINQ